MDDWKQFLEEATAPALDAEAVELVTNVVAVVCAVALGIFMVWNHLTAR
jgi:hypothetical protein